MIWRESLYTSTLGTKYFFSLSFFFFYLSFMMFYWTSDERLFEKPKVFCFFSSFVLIFFAKDWIEKKCTASEDFRQYCTPHHQPAAPDAVAYAVMAVLHIQKNMGPGDILVFMPGEPEIQRGMGMLVATSASLEVIPLCGALSKSQQQRIYQQADVRRCILSTNIAETSLTIPNIVYVIDLGLAKEMVWNPRCRMYELRRATISKFSTKQRLGRAGRTADE